MGPSGRGNHTVGITDRSGLHTGACPGSTYSLSGMQRAALSRSPGPRAVDTGEDRIHFYFFHVRNFKYKENQAKTYVKIRTHLALLHSVLATCV